MNDHQLLGRIGATTIGIKFLSMVYMGTIDRFDIVNQRKELQVYDQSFRDAGSLCQTGYRTASINKWRNLLSMR